LELSIFHLHIIENNLSSFQVLGETGFTVKMQYLWSFNSDVFSSFPAFNLDSVTLRKFYLDKDYIDYYHYLTKPEVAKYLAQADIPSSLENAKTELNYWARLFDIRSSFYWGIASKDTNKLIGTCGFNYWNRDHKRTEISYDLDHDYWGNGIMTKSVEAICSFAIQTLDVRRIQATVAIDNIPSIRVLEKCGFIQESIMKKFGILHNESKDFYMYVKLA